MIGSPSLTPGGLSTHELEFRFNRQCLLPSDIISVSIIYGHNVALAPNLFDKLYTNFRIRSSQNVSNMKIMYSYGFPN